MKSCLIVDDAEDIRDVLAKALSLEGWVIQSTDSLLGALTIVENNSDLDCMLLDYNLPGMPLEDFLQKFRAFCPQTAIVMISAVDELEEKAAKYAVPHFLQKPLDFDALRKAMSAALAAAGRPQ